ncbi:unnamed protein product [Cuscuta campestris]|uniref:Replication factor A C-terminal domain-containing protein n=1 Tax=Cuscuta campestris TaxID=132261 RepID=A0A484MRX1_9ASTE|nr:unnamed protein product [Cuscuta campestris]
MYGTRLLLNPEIEEVVTFRQRAVRADGTMYYCAYCGCRVMNVTPRYLIKLSVRDDSGSAIFVLFDHEAASILNMSCSLLLEKTDSDGSTESPKEFADFLMVDEDFLELTKAATIETLKDCIECVGVGPKWSHAVDPIIVMSVRDE